MRHLAWSAAILLSLVICATPGHAVGEDETEVVKDTTSEFKQADAQALAALAASNFLKELQPFSFGVVAADPIDVKTAPKMPNLGQGDSAARYDIVLQPGHYLRKPPGKLGTSGKLVSEQELTAFITANVAKYLIDTDKNLKVLVISADDYNRPLNTNVFLSIHADGSEKPCTSGPSLGYGEGSSLLGMHAIAFALATSMGQTYEDFQKDNFTTNLSKYYAFKSMNLPNKGFAGVLEVGELTCPQKENALIAGSLLIAKNVGVALKASNEIIKEQLEAKK